MPPRITNHIIEEEKITIWHPKKDSPGYSISFDSGGWMPGTYDCIESAKLGVKACFVDEHKFVMELQQNVNHFDKQNRLLTINDISEWLKQFNFDKWYAALEIHFSKRDVDYKDKPDEWCEKAVWMKHYSNGLSVENAYLEEC